MSTPILHSSNGLETPNTSLPDSDENMLKDVESSGNHQQESIAERQSTEVLQTPVPRQDIAQPPPSTKRWTWEVVSEEDGRPSKKRRQTSPNLDPEALSSKGIRTRQMARKGKGDINTPPNHSAKPSPKIKKQQNSSTTIDDSEDDVVPTSIRVAKQRQQRREKNKVLKMTSGVRKPKEKTVRVSKKRIPRIMKPSKKGLRIPRQMKTHGTTKPKGRAVRMPRQTKAERRVRIAKSPVLEDGTSLDWQEDVESVGDGAGDYGHVRTSLESGNYKLFYNSFSNDVPQRMVVRRNHKNVARGDLFPKGKGGPVAPLRLTDIIPSKITQSMVKSMAQRHRIYERKKAQDEQVHTSFVAVTNSVGPASEIDQLEDQQAIGHTDDHSMSLSGGLLEPTIRGIGEVSGPVSTIETFNTLTSTTETGLLDETGRAGPQDDDMIDRDSTQEYRAMEPGILHQGGECHNLVQVDVVSTHPQDHGNEPSENEMEIADVSAGNSKGSDKGVPMVSRLPIIELSDNSSKDSNDEGLRERTRQNFSAYDKHMEEDDDMDDEEGDSAWEREEDYDSEDEDTEEDDWIPGRYAHAQHEGDMRPVIFH